MYNFGFYGTVLNDLELAVFFKTEKKCTTDIKQKVEEHGKIRPYLNISAFKSFIKFMVTKKATKMWQNLKKVADFVKNLGPF